MSTTEESLKMIVKRMFYIYSSKYSNNNWSVDIKNITVHKYARSNNYAVSFELVYNTSDFDNDITDIVCYEVKKIETECYEIFKTFYITEELKLATDNTDVLDDIVAYLYYMNIDATIGKAEFKLSFEYNYYFK